MKNDKPAVSSCQEHPDNCPPVAGQNDPWLCHVCGDGYRSQRATACAICFQVACQAHIRLTVVDNPTYQHRELKLVCSHCEQKLARSEHDPE